MEMVNKNLLDAIENNAPCLVDLYLKQGAEVSDLAMCMAAYKGNIKIFKMLIEAGGSIDTCDYPAHSFAAKNDKWEIVEHIAKIKLGKTRGCSARSKSNVVNLRDYNA